MFVLLLNALWKISGRTLNLAECLKKCALNYKSVLLLYVQIKEGPGYREHHIPECILAHVLQKVSKGYGERNSGRWERGCHDLNLCFPLK